VKEAVPGVEKLCVFEPTVKVSVTARAVVSDNVMVSPAFSVTLKTRVKAAERVESVKKSSPHPLAASAEEGAIANAAAAHAMASAIALYLKFMSNPPTPGSFSKATLTRYA
jgi:hypothetical protein